MQAKEAIFLPLPGLFSPSLFTDFLMDVAFPWVQGFSNVCIKTETNPAQGRQRPNRILFQVFNIIHKMNCFSICFLFVLGYDCYCGCRSLGILTCNMPARTLDPRSFQLLPGGYEWMAWPIWWHASITHCLTMYNWSSVDTEMTMHIIILFRNIIFWGKKTNLARGGKISSAICHFLFCSLSKDQSDA